MALKRTVAPIVSPITLAEAKLHCRIDGSDEDTLIQALIDAAVSHLDGYSGVLGRCLLQQTWELSYDAFPAGDLQIPLGNLISVDSVQYAHPATGVMTTWASTNYEVDAVSIEGRIVPVEAWPDAKSTTNAVKITFKAGYGATASDVPSAIRHAIKLLVGHWYENREAVAIGASVSPVEMTVDALILPFRRQVL